MASCSNPSFIEGEEGLRASDDYNEQRYPFTKDCWGVNLKWQPTAIQRQGVSFGEVVALY
jgi:hypothetical protein